MGGIEIKLNNKRVTVYRHQMPEGNNVFYIEFKKLTDDVDRQKEVPTCKMEINKNVVTTSLFLSEEGTRALTQLLLEQLHEMEDEKWTDQTDG